MSGAISFAYARNQGSMCSVADLVTAMGDRIDHAIREMDYGHRDYLQAFLPLLVDLGDGLGFRTFRALPAAREELEHAMAVPYGAPWWPTVDAKLLTLALRYWAEAEAMCLACEAAASQSGATSPRL